MKTLTVTLVGAQRYWSNPELVEIVNKRSGWDEPKVRDFLRKNQFVHFKDLSGESAKKLFEELDGAGFEIHVQETKQGIEVGIALPYEAEVQDLRIQTESLLGRIEQLEALKGAGRSEGKAGRAEAYSKLIDDRMAPISPKPESDQKTRIREEKLKREDHMMVRVREHTTEESIGRYWLSRIGIFTLLLGVVFLITYTSRFLGAWGKLAIGALIGGLLAGVGNLLAHDEHYRKWAMAAIGGGWAILFFTVFAAYHVPVVKVIQSPSLGLLCLLFVSIFSIAQSLHHRSSVLVVMSYLLGFIAIVSTDVSFYSLFASYFLAVSLVIVTQKLGWNWLACLGLLIVYGTHWVWVEPSIYLGMESFAGQERFWEMLYLPFVGNEWRIYPIIDIQRSILHLLFLVLYWTLFTAMDFFRPSKKAEDQKEDWVTMMVLFANGVIFSLSFIHHLHVYYPVTKYLFAAVMGLVFLLLSMREKARSRPLLSDIYLGFAVSLICLIIPMYFDGSSVTYGWSVASPVLIWLGVRHKRSILRIVGGILGAIVLIRLLSSDYLERERLLALLSPINSFLLIAGVASLAFVMIYFTYERFREIFPQERRVVSPVALISSCCVTSLALLMGGLREISSIASLLLGCLLVATGVLKKRLSLRIAGTVFIFTSSVRLLLVDYGYEMVLLFSDFGIAARYMGGFFCVLILAVLSEWFRQRTRIHDLERWPFPCFLILSLFLFLGLVSDQALKACLSLLWGVAAFGYLIFGFRRKEKLYRWVGLGTFALVVGRLFLYDLGELQRIYRIISFIGLGAVFIVASLIYNYYSKILLTDEEVH